MPLTVQSRNVILHDGTTATAALGREHIEVVVSAVRFAVPLVEALLAELLPALSAEEVFHVPRLLEGRHTFLQIKAKSIVIFEPIELSGSHIEDRSIAIGTTRREQIMIVGFTIRTSVALEEVPRAELLRAMGAREVLRMPRPSERRDDLTDDRLVASAAASLLCRCHALARHVGVQ
jgi:uncharacterized DUF497 family protein